MAPSAIQATDGVRTQFPGCRAMTDKDIAGVIDAFQAAAR